MSNDQWATQKRDAVIFKMRAWLAMAEPLASAGDVLDAFTDAGMTDEYYSFEGGPDDARRMAKELADGWFQQIQTQ